MLFLLALPIFLTVAAAHRYLTLYAPSNLLIRYVRTSPPRWRTVGALVVLTGVLLLAMRVVEVAIAAGALSGFNLITLVLAWDSIKVAVLTTVTSLRCLTCACKRFHHAHRGPGSVAYGTACANLNVRSSAG